MSIFVHTSTHKKGVTVIVASWFSTWKVLKMMDTAKNQLLSASNQETSLTRSWDMKIYLFFVRTPKYEKMWQSLWHHDFPSDKCSKSYIQLKGNYRALWIRKHHWPEAEIWKYVYFSTYPKIQKMCDSYCEIMIFHLKSVENDGYS